MTWKSGSNNNDPIIEYIVYHNTSTDGQQGFTECSRRSAGLNTLRVTINVRPWMIYSFFVMARNNLGTSDYSLPSATVCKTPESKPSHNPTGVCTRLGEQGKLIIVWEVCSTFILFVHYVLDTKIHHTSATQLIPHRLSYSFEIDDVALRWIKSYA